MSGAPSYPISTLLAQIVRDSGYSSAGFTSALGYPVAEPGLNEPEYWLKTGEGPEGIIAQIAVTYPGEADELTKALGETADMKAAGVDPAALKQSKEEESFRPCIHADGETTVPNGVTLFGISGGRERWSTIRIPGAVLKMPLEEQLVKLRN